MDAETEGVFVNIEDLSEDIPSAKVIGICNNIDDSSVFKILSDLHQHSPEQETGCSFSNKQSAVNPNRDDPEEDSWRPQSPSVSNNVESKGCVDDCETMTFCLSPTTFNQDAPQFETVFLDEIHQDEDVSASDEEHYEQISSNEHLSGNQEPQAGCSSWSGEVDLPSRKGSDSTIVNPKSGSHQDKDCPDEGNMQERFSQKYHLEKNIRIHIGENRLQCTICSKSFSENFYLLKHMRAHSRENLFPCTVCSKSFSERSYLKRHLSTHTGEKPFLCAICGKSFSKKTNLMTHMRTHSGEKPFQCKICSERFSQKINLQNHIRKHTGEKPLECTVCSKRFSLTSCLDIHMKTHTGEKPFACEICSKRFSHRSNLRDHIMIHTGEKPFQCTLCSKRFGWQSKLKRHMTSHDHQGSRHTTGNANEHNAN